MLPIEIFWNTFLVHYVYVGIMQIGRHELLSIIRKHSKSIGKTTLDEEVAQDDLEMDPSFWHNIVDSYYVRSRESRGREDDDLIFFVIKMVAFLPL